jgi:hypothetical protein
VLSKLNMDQCHVIEVLVGGCPPTSGEPQRGCGFHNGNTGGAEAHSFSVIGGDTIVWFYNPRGDPSGCPTLDAGLDGAFPDATPDAPVVVSDGGSD